MGTTSIDGPTVTSTHRTIRLVGADTSVSFATGPAGGFAQWARPRHVEVTHADGSVEAMPIPDVTLLVRAAALIALALLTLMKGSRT